MVVRKTVSIEDEQEEFIEDEHLSLSSFVQDKLDEEMNRRDYEP